VPTAIVAQGAGIGIMVALPLLNWVIVRYSWHWAFGVLGIAGLVRSAIQPNTMLRWDRSGFLLYGRWKSRLRQAQGRDRGSRPDSADKCRKPTLGRASSPCQGIHGASEPECSLRIDARSPGLGCQVACAWCRRSPVACPRNVELYGRHLDGWVDRSSAGEYYY
jgi:hypothetical protein